MASPSGLPATTESTTAPVEYDSNIRLTKRKLDDAFHVLDNAVSHDNQDRPSPPKRSNTLKSLYSTLAKYGIKTKETRSISAPPPQTTSLTKNTPHLTAILSRAASKTKKSIFPAHSPAPAPFLPATAEYRPSSLPSFLSRLGTFKLSTYANKPVSIDAVAASKCGWINDGQDRLVCGLCKASWVVAGREGLSRDAANALIERQRSSLIDAHKNGCPWKTRQCDDSIYCIPLQPAAAMIKEIKARARIMDPLVKDICIKHPLTTTQLNAFSSTVASHTTRELDDSENANSQARHIYSETALLTALFGWSLVPPSASQSQPRRRVASSSRANSTAPPSPSLSRASSVAPTATDTSRPGTGGASGQPNEFTFRFPSNINLSVKPENALLQCGLCQRRIGLWSFITQPVTSTSNGDMNHNHGTSPPINGAGNADPGIGDTHFQNNINTPLSRPKKGLPRRAFDLLKEHRSYCPYTVRSTAVPSLSLPTPPTIPQSPTKSPSSAFIFKNGNASQTSFHHRSESIQLGGVTTGMLEGWRAVLTVVLRYRMAEKQRIEYNFLLPRENGQPEPGGGDEMEVDNVKAMVNGVKTRGGKDLLKYVKGLLG